MSKEQELERQLVACRAAKEALRNKLDGCMMMPDAQKAKIYNIVTPVIKTAIERHICGSKINRHELADFLLDKYFKALCGEDVFDNLNKV